MENRRYFLIALVAVCTFFLYQAWQKDYPAHAAANAQDAQRQSPLDSAAYNADAKPQPASQAAAVDTGVPTDEPPTQVPATAAVPAASATQSSSGQILQVTTDQLDVRISLDGGVVRSVQLLGIPVSKERPEQDLHLLDDQLPYFFVLQSGLIGTKEQPAPNHHSHFTTPKTHYVMGQGQDTLMVPLTWKKDGRSVTKTFTFHRGSYQIELAQTVNNNDQPWPLSSYVRFWRTGETAAPSPPFVQTFMGIGWYENKGGEGDYRFNKLQFEDLQEEPLHRAQVGGWIAMLQHYFAAAAIPTTTGQYTYFADDKPLPSGTMAYEAGYVSPRQLVPANGSKTFTDKLFIGPENQNILSDVAPGFELVVDYGILTVVAEPLFWILEKFHQLTGNWGFAIILLTLVVKLAFWKLTEAQYRSMGHMRKFTPRIKALKERYADDRQGMHKAMMDLYKKEKFNPLGGCWPMVVQFPVFIALYWVLLQSVELRQAPFIWWINDLTAPDPYFVLPVLYGISMWAQQKLSGQMETMEPAQKRIMSMMPVGLAIFFTFFPVGLVIYWLFSNCISICQQWFINRKLDREEETRKQALKEAAAKTADTPAAKPSGKKGKQGKGKA